MTWNPTKGRAFWTHLWGVNHGYTTHPPDACITNLGELLEWIEPKISRPTAHPKPPTTKLHLDGFLIKLVRHLA